MRATPSCTTPPGPPTRRSANSKRRTSCSTLLPTGQCDTFRALWDEFEARRTPEARFAKAMDRLQPLLLNYGNKGGTWRTPGVTEADVRARKSVIGDASAHLWEYAQSLIDTGAENGWVARAKPES